MVEQLRRHRAYILMFTLNLAVLIGVLYIMRRPEPRVITIFTPVPTASQVPNRAGAVGPLATETLPPRTPTVILLSQDKVNINTATVEQLDALPHIGPVLAQRIVAFRSEQGPFKGIEDIKQVDGIGDATFQDLRDLITVK